VEAGVAEMNASVGTVLIAVVVILSLAVVVRRFSKIKQSYYSGVSLWNRWLPVFSTGVFLAVFAANIAGGDNLAGENLDLFGYFNMYEMFVLFFVAPFFLTRMGSFLAAASLVYTAQKLFGGDVIIEPKLSLYLLLSSTTIVAILGDRMPWLIRMKGPSTGQKIRESLLLFVAVSALGLVFASIIKIYGFNRWMAGSLDIGLPAPVTVVVLAIVLLGWLSVALGMTRHLSIPLLSLPTLFVLAYITSWPSTLLVIPFAACLALSLATADRRFQNRRRTTGFSTTYFTPR
jgi:hypothetical protein